MKVTAKRGLYSSGKWIKQLGSIKNDTEAIKGTTEAIKGTAEAIKADTTSILGLLKGQEVERDKDQSDKERLKQIRTIKRQLDNEVADLKEREGKRLHLEKTAQHATVQESLDEVAEKLEGETTADKKATLLAALKALKAKEADEKKAKAKAKAKAKTTAKAKAKTKAKAKAERKKAKRAAPHEDDEAKEEAEDKKKDEAAPQEDDEAKEEAEDNNKDGAEDKNNNEEQTKQFYEKLRIVAPYIDPHTATTQELKEMAMCYESVSETQAFT